MNRYASRSSTVALVSLFMLWLSSSIGLAEYSVGESVEGGRASSPLMQILADELAYAMANLAMPDGIKPYYLSYTVTAQESCGVSCSLGALTNDSVSKIRVLDVDVRVGDYHIDSSHKLRGGGGRRMGSGVAAVCLEDDAVALKQAIWLTTDRQFKRAAKRFQQVQTNLKTQVEEEDKSDDFSQEKPAVYSEPRAQLSLDMSHWRDCLRRVSSLAARYPLVYSSRVSLTAECDNKCMVTSEGTRLQTGQKFMRVVLSAQTKAEDGMELELDHTFDACDESKLPSETEISEAFQAIMEQLVALRSAPIVEPYVGPAILRNRASGVFFHEIFGHRIEGHRQKDVDEGQTFTKKLGEEILPRFLTVRDDPTRREFGDIDLRGFYKYDDEGVLAQNVDLIENGVLKAFLMSRSPIEGFSVSNGHGRRLPGRAVVSRQGNLIVESSNAVSSEGLRERLLEECRKQDKPYGLLFEDISGGFTTTARRGPQAFKVLPLVVYKVYADGRPDELVRGVDIVGTPLSCFSKIEVTGDDPAVFNGTCGAESGNIPVSAISPSILVSQIEIEKRRREQDKPPILLPPIAVEQRQESEDAS